VNWWGTVEKGGEEGGEGSSSNPAHRKFRKGKGAKFSVRGKTSTRASLRGGPLKRRPTQGPAFLGGTSFWFRRVSKVQEALREGKLRKTYTRGSVKEVV